MATVRQRESGYWQAIVRRKGHQPVSRTFRRQIDAEAWSRKVEGEQERGLWRDTSAAETTTVANLIEIYQERELPSKRGKHFSSALGLLASELGRYPLSALASKVISDMRDKRLKAGLSASTVRKEINLLSRMIDLAGKEWGVPLAANPCKMVSRPAERNARDRRLRPGELGALTAVAEDRVVLLACVAIETAARLGELLALRWRDVGAKAITLRGIEQRGLKNDEAKRAAPLSETAVAALKYLRQLQKSEKIRPVDGLVFGCYWKASDSFSKIWRRAAVAAGCPDLRFHDLRHEAASRLFEMGVFRDGEIAEITGHKSLSMLKRYTHLNAEKLAEKMRSRV